MKILSQFSRYYGKGSVRVCLNEMSSMHTGYFNIISFSLYTERNLLFQILSFMVSLICKYGANKIFKYLQDAKKEGTCKERPTLE